MAKLRCSKCRLSMYPLPGRDIYVCNNKHWIDGITIERLRKERNG